MSPADGNPTQRPLHPWPAGSFQAKRKSQPALEAGSTTLYFTSVQRADSNGWFYFRPSAHIPKYSPGLCASSVKPPEKNLLGSTSCHTSRPLINQLHLVSSSWSPFFTPPATVFYTAHINPHQDFPALEWCQNVTANGFWSWELPKPCGLGLGEFALNQGQWCNASCQGC